SHGASPVIRYFTDRILDIGRGPKDHHQLLLITFPSFGDRRQMKSSFVTLGPINRTLPSNMPVTITLCAVAAVFNVYVFALTPNWGGSWPADSGVAVWRTARPIVELFWRAWVCDGRSRVEDQIWLPCSVLM